MSTATLAALDAAVRAHFHDTCPGNILTDWTITVGGIHPGDDSYTWDTYGAPGTTPWAQAGLQSLGAGDLVEQLTDDD